MTIKKRDPEKWHQRQIPSYIEVGEKTGLMFEDNNGQIRTRAEFYEMMELGKLFYDTPGVDEWIVRQNKMTPLSTHELFEVSKVVDEKLVLPRPRYTEKKLREYQRIECDWCGTIKEGEQESSFFVLHSRLDDKRNVEGSCCQKACAENLWYDQVIEWVNEKGLNDVVHTDKYIGIEE